VKGLLGTDIADELVVTLETVKKHLSHIFDKIAATSRTGAVSRARELGLTPEGAPLTSSFGHEVCPPEIPPWSDVIIVGILDAGR
jgi:hypothetical protein